MSSTTAGGSRSSCDDSCISKSRPGASIQGPRMRLNIPAVGRMLRHDIGQATRVGRQEGFLSDHLANGLLDFSTSIGLSAHSYYDAGFQAARKSEDHQGASDNGPAERRSMASAGDRFASKEKGKDKGLFKPAVVVPSEIAIQATASS